MLDVSVKDFLALQQAEFVNISDRVLKIRHIKGISIDSRTIEPQQVFWAIKGENFDGHTFIPDVTGKGALFSVMNRASYRSEIHARLPLLIVPDTLKALHELARAHRLRYNIPVIAITGSNGKTTTKEMVAHIMQQKMTVHKTHGNRNNQIGCPLTVVEMNEMHKAAVFELGTNQFGEIRVLSKIVEPNHALITLVGDTHLEYLQDRDGVAREKLDLFRYMKAGATIYKNMDDPYIAAFHQEGVREVTYGFEAPEVQVKGRLGRMDEMGCGQLILNENTTISLKAPGWHNVRNALAAAAVTQNLGFSEQEIASALSTYESFEKRMQVIHWNDCIILNDTYNANPASMLLAMDTLMSMERGEKFMALGDMNELGVQSEEMHVRVLRKALEHRPRHIFILGEKMSRAAEMLPPAGLKTITLCKSQHELAHKASAMMKAGDILLLKASRGIQMEKVLAGLPAE